MPPKQSQPSLSSASSSTSSSSSSNNSSTSSSSRSRSSSSSKSRRSRSSSGHRSPSTSSSSSLRTQSTSRSSQKRRGGAQKNRSKGSRGIQRSLSRDRHHKEPVARRNVDSVGDRRTGDRSRKFSNQSTERNGNRKVSLRGRERGRLMGSRSPSHSRDCHRSERGRPMQRGTGERHKGHSLQKSSRDMDNGNERDRSRGKSKRDPKSRSDEYWGGPEDRKEQSREKEKRLGSRERHGRSNYHNRPDSHNHRRPREINTDRRKSPVTKHRVRELSSSPAQGYHKRRKVESKDQARDDAPSQWTKPGNTERDSVPHPVEEAEPREPNGHGRRSGDAVQIPENAKENPQDSLLESSRWGSGPRRNTGSKDAGDGAPNFGLSGKLAEESRKVKGVVLKFTEPPEARKPDMRWRLYIFKGGDSVGEPIPIHRQSCYLFGRDRGIADIPTDHPSCSKQHSALQFRLVEIENADGTITEIIKPYLMDLESVNGTFINREKVQPQRYYELMEQDTIRFGLSSREYVLLHEGSIG